MADQLIDRIMDNARSRLPGAVDQNIYQELQYTLDDFFKQSGCWRERIEVDVEADTLDYEIYAVDMPAQIYSLVNLTNADGTLINASLVNMGSALRLYRDTTPGTYYATCILTVAPKTGNQQYPRFPQWVADRYADVISDGVAGKLMALPAKPFSSPTHSLFFQRKFRSATSAIKMEVNNGSLYSGQNWSYPYFGARG